MFFLYWCLPVLTLSRLGWLYFPHKKFFECKSSLHTLFAYFEKVWKNWPLNFPGIRIYLYIISISISLTSDEMLRSLVRVKLKFGSAVCRSPVSACICSISKFHQFARFSLLKSIISFLGAAHILCDLIWVSLTLCWPHPPPKFLKRVHYQLMLALLSLPRTC